MNARYYYASGKTVRICTDPSCRRWENYSDGNTDPREFWSLEELRVETVVRVCREDRWLEERYFLQFEDGTLVPFAMF